MTRFSTKTLVIAAALGALTTSAFAQSPAPTLPPGYMPVEQSRPLVERAGRLRVTSDISDLSAGEKAAVAVRGPAIVEVDVTAVGPTPAQFTPPVSIPGH